VKNIVSLTDLLQKALDEAKQEANNIIHAAQLTAEEMVAKARMQAEKEAINAQLLLKQKEEAKIRKEAHQILVEYQQKAASSKSLSKNRITLALDLVLKEALPNE
jgi:vacuolar-type H+-ATPase subunit H